MLLVGLLFLLFQLSASWAVRLAALLRSTFAMVMAIANISTLDQLFEWANLRGLQSEILTQLGNAGAIQNIAFLTEAEWEGFIAAVRVPDGADGLRALNLSERSSTRGLRTAARAATGLEALSGGSPQPAATEEGSRKRIKLSAMVGVSADTELVEPNANPLTPDVR